MTTFILAVDHRNSLRGWLSSLGVPAAMIEPRARRLKSLCVEALESASDELEAGETPMLPLDEEYGVDAIPAAKQLGLPIVRGEIDEREAASQVATAYLGIAAAYRAAELAVAGTERETDKSIVDVSEE